MNILVTGAAGFIASHLCERLVTFGHAVRGIDCFTDYYARALKDLNVRQIQDVGVEFLPLDLATDDLSAALQDVELVYHLAGQPGISATTPFDAYLRNNVIATQRLLDAAEATSLVQAFVNISTSSVYGSDATRDESAEPKPTSYYGVTKLAAEQLVLAAARDRDFPTCSLRLFSVYGPRERPEKLYPKLIRAILQDRPFPLYVGSKKHLRSYTYVGDIIDGLVAVLNNFAVCKGEIFNIGSDKAHTTAEGIEIVEELLGKPACFDSKPRRPGDQLRTHANIDKARRALGYNPCTSLREGLAQEVAWYTGHIFNQVDF